MSERLLMLVRHGESDFDSVRMSPSPRGDQWDPPLSEKGREQAASLARRLRWLNPQPAAVYSSPLRRAMETASSYAEGAGIEVTADDDLMEAHIGGWEAKSFEEILASDDELLHRVRSQRPIWSRAPGGERPADFRRRVGGAIGRILERHPEGDVVVVCHGGVINAYCGEVLGVRQEMFFLPENTSVNSVEIDGEERRIRFLNDIAHLTDPKLFDT
ncbi:MAG TPA: histidine phosphatase family protein [Actinomycetota bacterium]